MKRSSHRPRQSASITKGIREFVINKLRLPADLPPEHDGWLL